MVLVELDTTLVAVFSAVMSENRRMNATSNVFAGVFVIEICFNTVEACYNILLNAVFNTGELVIRTTASTYETLIATFFDY